MKKIKSIMCLLMALTILCGSSMTAFAIETTESDNFAFSSTRTVYNTDGSVKYTESVVGNIPMMLDGYELIGRTIKQEHDEGYTTPLDLFYVKNGDTKQLSQMYNLGHEINIVERNTNEEGITTTKYYGTDGYITQYYEEYELIDGVLSSKTEFIVYSGSIKLFKTQEDFDTYRNDGTGEYEEIRGETYDKSIGYLHGIEYNYLVQTDEEGVPTEAYYQFTWDKYYEEYDNSYSVDIYAVCNLETKQFFGLGSSDIKQSERMYVKTVPYLSDSESGFAEITNSEMNEIFSTFWSAGEKIYESRAWTYDYYFRIVKDGRYGPWTVYDHKYGPLTGSDEAYIYVAEDDESGSMTKDTNTEYGSGITYDPNVGVGDTKNEAFEDLLDDETFSPTNINQWFSWLYDVFSGMISSLGQFPQFIGQVFTFLPSEITMLLCAAIVICVVCRLLGR